MSDKKGTKKTNAKLSANSKKGSNQNKQKEATEKKTATLNQEQKKNEEQTSNDPAVAATEGSGDKGTHPKIQQNSKAAVGATESPQANSENMDTEDKEQELDPVFENILKEKMDEAKIPDFFQATMLDGLRKNRITSIERAKETTVVEIRDAISNLLPEFFGTPSN